ncbi:Hypothetical_protein [Hexamita inflata]|uniref:Hypothetical_protein n=1 Tax=Hexamita inflata TaxID=28002 RepID=A0AA86NDZ9_9EUKA|nr:Hypothetical protein HINF_LOCUS5424 [Hexamita inflata]CAI9943767.1 Hypothetical protein HINF_LOCUS31412 [Hexamita inflata]
MKSMKAKSLVKRLLFPTDSVIDHKRVFKLIDACKNAEVAKLVAKFVFSIITTGDIDVQIKLGYVFTNILLTYPTELITITEELIHFGFDKVTFQEFYILPIQNVVINNNFAKKTISKDEKALEQIRLTTKIIRSLIGFCVSVGNIEKADLPIIAIQKSLVVAALKQLSQLLTQLVDAQREESDIYKIKPEISDLSLCLRQLEDYMNLVKKEPAEIKQIDTEIFSFFNAVRKQQKMEIEQAL